MEGNILELKHLKKYFPVKRKGFWGEQRFVKAVDDVSFNIRRGEVVGIVGESGCGKSTLVNTVLKLTNPTDGQVLFDGKDLYALNKRELQAERKNIQIVFQDPYWSLNPRMLVKDIVGEPLAVQTKMNTQEILAQVQKTLQMVGLPPEGAFLYPHEFSNGERQRIAIARALVLQPKLVVLDEPTSSIDVVSQVQILDLLGSLKEQLQLTYILISHDLSVVHYMADKIAVMYLGRLVEYGDSDEVFHHPQHPYTRALFAAIPSMDTDNLDDISTLDDNLPSAINVPDGCCFHTRCPYAAEQCAQQLPKLRRCANGVIAACHLLAAHDSQEV